MATRSLFSGGFDGIRGTRPVRQWILARQYRRALDDAE